MKYFRVTQTEKIIREFVVRADEEHEANVVGWDSEPEYHQLIDQFVDEVIVAEIDDQEFEIGFDCDSMFFDCETEDWLSESELDGTAVAQ